MTVDIFQHLCRICVCIAQYWKILVVFTCKNGKIADSASLGAALRAAHGWICNKKGKFIPISQIYSGMLEKTSLICNLAVTAGDQEIVSKYSLLMRKRMEIENRLVQKLGRWDHFVLWRNWIIQNSSISLKNKKIKEKKMAENAEWVAFSVEIFC